VATESRQPREGAEDGEATALQVTGAEDPYLTIRSLLTSTSPEELRNGLELAKHEITRVGPLEAKELFEIVSVIFYIDPLDRPDLVPILDEAVNLVVGFGEWVIPMLVDHLEAGDIKAQLAVGHALGRIGAEAIEPLMAKYAASADPSTRTFVLYALGKVKSPRIVKAASLVLEAARSDDLELRDTATRAIGKLAESIPAEGLTDDLRRKFLERLHANLADTNAVVRAKAVRSLGKLAKAGHLRPPEREALEAVCKGLLGKDESFEWDRAYGVRREAEETLRYVRG
jgi:HEAT repeat protein